jgi:hypothetical protein
MEAAYEIQTTHGYYPIGTWGHASYHFDLETAIQNAKRWNDCRVIERSTGRIVWPVDSDESDDTVYVKTHGW